MEGPAKKPKQNSMIEMEEEFIKTKNSCFGGGGGPKPPKK